MGVRRTPHIKIVNKKVGTLISEGWLTSFWSLQQLDTLKKYKPVNEPYFEISDTEVANILEDLNIKYYYPLALAVQLRPLNFGPNAANDFLEAIYNKIKTTVAEHKIPSNRRSDGVYQLQIHPQLHESGTPVDIFIDDENSIVADNIASYSEIKIPNINEKDMLVLIAYEDTKGKHLKLKKMIDVTAGLSPIYNSFEADWKSNGFGVDAHLQINSADTMKDDLFQLIGCVNFLHDLA